MGVGQPRQRAAHALRFGGVDAQAGTAGLGAEIEHVEAAPRAGNNGRKAAGEMPGLRTGTADAVARRAVEKLEIALDRILGIARLDGADVSGIDVSSDVRSYRASTPATAVARSGRAATPLR